MLWFVIIFFLCSIFNGFSEAGHHKRLHSAVVVGTVYCDTCLQEDFSKNSHFISGAAVAVECKDENSGTSFEQEVKTNEHGEFKVHLPFSVGKHVKRIKKCSVKLVSSSEPYCSVASTATSSSLRLKSRKQGLHIFSAGFFTFKPQKQPTLCYQRPSIENSKEFNSKIISSIPASPGTIPSFAPPIQDPTNPNLPPVNQHFLPPIPFLPQLPPLPPLPSLPPLPGLPTIPPFPGNSVEQRQTSPEDFNKPQEPDAEQPNFFFPVPKHLPPNGFQSSPSLQTDPLQPSPLLPDDPLQPPPTPLLPLPPNAGLIPPPIVPLPPVIPFPPFPFRPSHRIGRISPAASSSSSPTSQKPSP